jgi:hypothetical protein
MDDANVVPSFMLMMPPMGIDYFGFFDSFFGTYSTKHLHIIVVMGIHDELVDKSLQFLQFLDDLESGVPAGSLDVFTLVVEKYLMLSNRE